MGHQTHKDAVSIASENDAVPSESQGQYIAQGLLVVDYGTEYSLNKEDAEGGASTRAFNSFAKASRVGGMGTLRSADSNLVAVGRFGTDGIRLLDQIGTADKKAKGLQFEEYAVLGPGDERYEQARELSKTMGSTVRPRSEAETEELKNMYSALRSEGRMRRPIR